MSVNIGELYTVIGANTDPLKQSRSKVDQLSKKMVSDLVEVTYAAEHMLDNVGTSGLNDATKKVKVAGNTFDKVLGKKYKAHLQADASDLESAKRKASAFTTDVKNAFDKLNAFSFKVNNVLSFASALKNLGASIINVGDKMVGLVTEQAALDDQLQKLSIRFNTSTEALSGLGNAAEKSGVNSKVLYTALQRMNRRIGESVISTEEAAKAMDAFLASEEMVAEEDMSLYFEKMVKAQKKVAESGGATEEALNQIGLSSKDLIDLSMPEQFLTIAEELSKVENASRRNALAMKFFDTEGVAVVQMLGEGRQGIEEYMREAERLGFTLEQNTADKAAMLNDAVFNVHATMKGFVANLSREAYPAFTQIATAISDVVGQASVWVKENRGLISIKLADWAEVVVDKIKDMAKWVEENKDKVFDLSKTFGKDLYSAFKSFGEISLKIIRSLGDLYTWWSDLNPVLRDASGYFAGITVAATPVITIFGTLGAAASTLGGIFKVLGGTTITKIFGGALKGLAASAIPTLTTAITTLGGVALKGLVAAFGALLSPIGAVVAALVGVGAAVYQVVKYWHTFKTDFDMLKSWIVRNATEIYRQSRQWLVTRYQGIRTGIKSFIDNIISYWRAVPGRLGNYFRSIYTSAKQWLNDRFSGIFSWIQSKIDALYRAWLELKRRLVGNSVIPDMIKEIGDEFYKLDAKMVDPVKHYTDEVLRVYDKTAKKIKQIDMTPEKRGTVSLDYALSGRFMPDNEPIVEPIDQDEVRIREFYDAINDTLSLVGEFTDTTDYKFRQLETDLYYTVGEIKETVVEDFQTLAAGISEAVNNLSNTVNSEFYEMESAIVSALDSIVNTNLTSFNDMENIAYQSLNSIIDNTITDFSDTAISLFEGVGNSYPSMGIYSSRISDGLNNIESGIILPWLSIVRDEMSRLTDTYPDFYNYNLSVDQGLESLQVMISNWISDMRSLLELMPPTSANFTDYDSAITMELGYISSSITSWVSNAQTLLQSLGQTLVDLTPYADSIINQLGEYGAGYGTIRKTVENWVNDIIDTLDNIGNVTTVDFTNYSFAIYSGVTGSPQSSILTFVADAKAAFGSVGNVSAVDFTNYNAALTEQLTNAEVPGTVAHTVLDSVLALKQVLVEIDTYDWGVINFAVYGKAIKDTLLGVEDGGGVKGIVTDAVASIQTVLLTVGSVTIDFTDLLTNVANSLGVGSNNAPINFVGLFTSAGEDAVDALVANFKSFADVEGGEIIGWLKETWVDSMSTVLSNFENNVWDKWAERLIEGGEGKIGLEGYFGRADDAFTTFFNTNGYYLIKAMSNFENNSWDNWLGRIESAWAGTMSYIATGTYYSGGAVTGYATGGDVKGPGGRDNVPAWLTAGEYVISKPAVDYYGEDVFEKYNKRKFKKQNGFFEGGIAKHLEQPIDDVFAGVPLFDDSPRSELGIIAPYTEKNATRHDFQLQLATSDTYMHYYGIPYDSSKPVVDFETPVFKVKWWWNSDDENDRDYKILHRNGYGPEAFLELAHLWGPAMIGSLTGYGSPKDWDDMVGTFYGFPRTYSDDITDVTHGEYHWKDTYTNTSNSCHLSPAMSIVSWNDTLWDGFGTMQNNLGNGLEGNPIPIPGYEYGSYWALPSWDMYPPGFHQGGYSNGGLIDTLPGEYVINPVSTSEYSDEIEAINNGTFESGNTYNININVSGNLIDNPTERRRFIEYIYEGIEELENRRK